LSQKEAVRDSGREPLFFAGTITKGQPPFMPGAPTFVSLIAIAACTLVLVSYVPDLAQYL
jgi:hypothetical protein